MGERVPLVLNVRGDLDTSGPISDRAPGSLTRARDLHSQKWGPRAGSQSFTRVWESPGTASLYDTITLLGTANAAHGFARSYEDSFGDLGTTFTLDLWFRLTSIGYASAVNRIGVYDIRPGGAGGAGSGIEVVVFGGAHSDHERIEVKITTSPTRSTAASTVTITGSTRLSFGSTQSVKYHVRVVRNGANAYLYLNGVLDGSTSSLSATEPINRTIGDMTDVNVGLSRNGDVSFNGVIYGAWLRDGAFATAPIEAVMPCAPWARNVHHAYLGRDISYGGVTHYFDAARFAAHAIIVAGGGSLGVDWTVTASNDNSAPAPAPVQGLRTWTTRTNRTASSAVVGGQLSTAIVS